MTQRFEKIFSPLTGNIPYGIETSLLICTANQLTGFCMTGNIRRYGLRF